MTREEILSIAAQCSNDDTLKNDLDCLVRFAELVAKHERGAIIALCAELDNDENSEDYRNAVRWMIERIRAR